MKSHTSIFKKKNGNKEQAGSEEKPTADPDREEREGENGRAQ